MLGVFHKIKLENGIGTLFGVGGLEIIGLEQAITDQQELSYI